MAMDTATTPIGPFTGAGTAFPILKAPSAGDGGGLTVLEASIANVATTSSTVGFSIALVKYSSAATPVPNGTVVAAIGGTAAAGTATDAHWTALVPRPFAPSGTAVYLAAGEWLYAVVAATNAGTPNAWGSLSYQRGR